MSRVCNLYQGSLCGDLSCDGDCSECGNPKAAHEGEPIINCGSEICLFSSMGNEDRTDTQCKCFDAAGFHGPLAMKAQQMLREVLLLRAKLDAAPRWIKVSDRLPHVGQLVVGRAQISKTRVRRIMLTYHPDPKAPNDPPWMADDFALYSLTDVPMWAPIPSEEA